MSEIVKSEVQTTSSIREIDKYKGKYILKPCKKRGSMYMRLPMATFQE